MLNHSYYEVASEKEGYRCREKEQGVGTVYLLQFAHYSVDSAHDTNRTNARHKGFPLRKLPQKATKLNLVNKFMVCVCEAYISSIKNR